VRYFTALGETRQQLILAAIITVGAGLWAWSLVAPSFAGPPQVMVPPGIIGVADEATSQTASAPIRVQAIYTPAANQAGGNYTVFFTQIVSEAARRQLSPTVIVFLCGPIGQHPEFKDNSFQLVHWRVPRSTPDVGIYSSVFGSLSDCVYTTLAMNWPGEQFRQAGISGSFDTATGDVSGTKVLYALPGIASWFMPVSINGLNPTAMPPGSTVTVQLNKDPVDLTNTFASPQLTDAGSLRWTGALGGTALPIEEYRMEADSQKAVSQLQLHLFLAGALVGVAGGAFV
jgi:hypothetical protein